MNSMEMERVTEMALSEFGMVVAREQLKVAKGLRKPLLFEEIAEKEVIDCPGLPLGVEGALSACFWSLGSWSRTRTSRRARCWRP